MNRLVIISIILLSLGACQKERTDPDSLITITKYYSVNKITCDTIFTFYVPSGFTPNGDWINELWAPKSCGLDPTNYHIDILTKKGDVIVSADNPINFDGRGKDGEILACQSLVYYIKAKDKFGNDHEFKGQFTIIR